jgi:hypothetical protein
MTNHRIFREPQLASNILPFFSIYLESRQRLSFFMPSKLALSGKRMLLPLADEAPKELNL